MGLDELCHNNDSKGKDSSLSTDSSVNNIESLYIELMQEKLLELMKYVRLNHYTNTININKSALIANGYKVNLN